MKKPDVDAQLRLAYSYAVDDSVDMKKSYERTVKQLISECIDYISIDHGEGVQLLFGKNPRNVTFRHISIDQAKRKELGV